MFSISRVLSAGPSLLLFLRLLCLSFVHSNMLDGYNHTGFASSQLLHVFKAPRQHSRISYYRGGSSCKCETGSPCCSIDPNCPAILSASSVPSFLSFVAVVVVVIAVVIILCFPSFFPSFFFPSFFFVVIVYLSNALTLTWAF